MNISSNGSSRGKRSGTEPKSSLFPAENRKGSSCRFLSSFTWQRLQIPSAFSSTSNHRSLQRGHRCICSAASASSNSLLIAISSTVRGASWSLPINCGPSSSNSRGVFFSAWRCLRGQPTRLRASRGRPRRRPRDWCGDADGGERRLRGCLRWGTCGTVGFKISSSSPISSASACCPESILSVGGRERLSSNASKVQDTFPQGSSSIYFYPRRPQSR